MVRHGEYKLITFGKDKVFGMPFPDQLFHLVSDFQPAFPKALSWPPFVILLYGCYRAPLFIATLRTEALLWAARRETRTSIHFSLSRFGLRVYLGCQTSDPHELKNIVEANPTVVYVRTQSAVACALYGGSLTDCV